VYPIDFIVNYDSTNHAWAWYVNGSPVRIETDTAFGGASHVEVGAVLQEAGTDMPAAWHSQLLVVQSSGRVSLFAPGDARRSHWTAFDRFSLEHFADGSVLMTEVRP